MNQVTIKNRSFLLSAIFTSDPIEYISNVTIIAFTIPEKKAFILKGELAEYFQDASLWQESQEAFYRKTVLSSEGVFERVPDWDVSEGSETVNRMFPDGFYEVDIHSRFYGGIGVTGFFIGLGEGEIINNQLSIKKGVNSDVWKN